MFAAILLGRAAKIGIPMQPPPWWATDNMTAYAIAPGIVTLFASGLASFGSWLLGGDWRAPDLVSAVGLAAVVAGYVALSRLLRAWAQSVRPSAEVMPLAPGGADNDPRRPPGMPPMKKAA
jgi:hypothetical protein